MEHILTDFSITAQHGHQPTLDGGRHQNGDQHLETVYKVASRERTKGRGRGRRDKGKGQGLGRTEGQPIERSMTKHKLLLAFISFYCTVTMKMAAEGR